MNLAFCHPVVVPARGGCESYIAALLRRLCADGHQVHLYASQWDADALPPAVAVHRVPSKSWPRFLRPWRFSAACGRATRGAGHDLTVGFDKVKGVDVVYPQGGLHQATVAYSQAKLPGRLPRALAAAARLLDPSYLSYRLFERRQYLAAPRPFVIVNSELVRGHLRRYLGPQAPAAAVLHSAMDTDRLAAADRPARRQRRRAEWGLAPDDTVALFVAMNYRLKGLAALLRAVARLGSRQRFRLLVVGDPDTRRYEALAARLGVAECVRFLGFWPNPREAFFAADLLVHPTFYDPCSLVVLEAQACGLPVVTTRANGAAELLAPPHDGLVIDDAHDAEALARALEYYRDPARRREASAAALRAARRWDFERHYRRLVGLFEEACRHKLAA